MSIRTALFSAKVDLDTLLATFLMGARLCETSVITFRVVQGSASAEELSDPTILCVEVGGSGRTAKNNFDHHGPGAPDKSSARQVFERLARVVQYVDELDRGRLDRTARCEFPSLSQLVAGMLLSVKTPEEQMREGHRILREVVESGIDPYGCMEPMLDAISGARAWAQAKRAHEALGPESVAHASWYVTQSGRKLAVVETEWYGAPGALYGLGAEIVIACNPSHGDKKIRKLTVAIRRDQGLTTTPFLLEVEALEKEWGGPAHGTICGSSQTHSSALGLKVVRDLVIANM